MLWFNGSIRNAVEKVKSSGVVLLVFVQGEDSLSRKYESFLNEESKFNPDDYVALKISQNSVAHKQFKEIYVTVPIPSVFLIANNGIPLKVVTSNKTSDIGNAINDLITESDRKNNQSNKLESNGDVLPDHNKKNQEDVQLKNSKRAQNIGDNLFDVSEDVLKQRLNEIRSFPRFLHIDTLPVHQSSFPQTLPRVQSARIQFRLPNNDTPSWEFPDQSTLGDVRAYLMEKMKLSPNFKLLRIYPKTAFTPQDECKTLMELSLTPNASLIVVPVEDKRVQAKIRSLLPHQSLITSMLKTFFQPLLIFIKYFKKHVLKMPDEIEAQPRRPISDTALDKISGLNKKTSTSNIHGFKFEEDSDADGDHPDNGNSTQQRFQK